MFAADSFISMHKFAPLLFEPVLMSKVWGGDRLAKFGKRVSPGETIGESWEVADLGATSASGAGGGSVRSRVSRGGPVPGGTLHDAMQAWGTGLLGRARKSESDEFPLLVKFLDARENLSVQVHPSPAYAARHPEAKLKTECWYIMDAAPGAVIYKGVRPGVSPEQFAAHIADNTVLNDMIAIPAVPGELHNLPSGTCHALGAGVLAAEVQTPSDTTFRVYDWGRTGRELHIPQALQCIDFGPAPAAIRLRSGAGGAGPILRTEFFEVMHLAVSGGSEQAPARGDACCIVMMLAGGASLYSESGAFAPMDLALGQTVLIPAAVASEAMLACEDGQRAECLVAQLP